MTGQVQSAGGRVHWTRARWGCAGVVVVLLLSACSGIRSNLGTANSPCYVALPAATDAVRHTGTLVGVRLERVGSLRLTHRLYQAAGGSRAGNARVCLVAFRGKFTAAGVTQPRGDPAGRLAVVVLSYPDNHVRATVVLRHIPVRFGHSHLL